MSDYIAFINQTRDAELFLRHYADAAGVRIPLSRFKELKELLPEDINYWIDAGIDSLHQGASMNSEYKTHIDSFRHGESLRRKGLAGSYAQFIVDSFVEDVLDKCEQAGANWISMPQVPYNTGMTAAKQSLNRQMAAAAERWRVSQVRNGKLMLPVILTNASAADAKGKWRNDIVKHVAHVCGICDVDGIWVVNTSLEDERGSSANQDKRFPGLIALHEELRSRIPDGTRVVCGPYWAMNMILWAKGLAENPAIGIAGGYRYFIPGGHSRTAADRVAVPPLLRRVKVNDSIGKWLQSSASVLTHVASPAGAIGDLGNSISRAASELDALAKQYRRLRGANAREQVAIFYREWFRRIQRVQPQIRALALRQEFSEANVIGSLLSDLPSGSYARQPGKLAQQFMLCSL